LTRATQAGWVPRCLALMITALLLDGGCAPGGPESGTGAATQAPATRSPKPAAAPPATGPPAAIRPLRDRVLFGAFTRDLPQGRTDLPALEDRIGARLEVGSTFVSWNHVFGGADDHWLSANGTRRIVTSWEPYGIRFRAVADGSLDDLLQRVVDRMKRYPHDIWVRPWPEMNASWSTWQPTRKGERLNGGTPAEFVAAWRHVVDYVRSRGVRNLRFVFNPDASDSPANTPVPTIWPGADYVDAIGIDGYNWGDDPARGERWTEFEDIFSPMYRIVAALHPTAPIWITETSSKEPGTGDGAPADPHHRRSEWIARMMTSTRFARLDVVAWFNVAKERDWRLESSDDSLTAIRAELAARNRPVGRG
jgi:hypothetical protein